MEAEAINEIQSGIFEVSSETGEVQYDYIIKLFSKELGDILGSSEKELSSEEENIIFNILKNFFEDILGYPKGEINTIDDILNEFSLKEYSRKFNSKKLFFTFITDYLREDFEKVEMYNKEPNKYKEENIEDIEIVKARLSNKLEKIAEFYYYNM